MIVRVRSNLGTVKLTIGDDEMATEATIRTRILQDLQEKTSIAHKLTQDLSFDPSGKRKIHSTKPLSEQGIQHGCMVYCRVQQEQEEEASNDSNESDTNNTEGVENNNILSTNNTKLNEQQQPKETTKRDVPKKNDCVIDLIDSSSDEEETNDANNDNDNDDDEVQVISPPKKRNHGSKTRAENPVPKSRKRPRTLSDGDATSKKATARNTTTTAGSYYPNFQIASYNVWFGPPDPEARQVYPQERMKGIVECLRVASQTKEHGKPCPLLFVGLQELTPSLVRYLEPSFQSMGYKLCTQTIGGFGGPSYGVGIAVPNDLHIVEQGFVPYKNSMQGRGFLFVRTPTLLFATTHLESWCGPQMTGAKEREVQMVEVAKYCREQFLKRGLELTAILGDLNWDDERKRKSSSETPNRNLLSILPNGWEDAGSSFDYTYDSKENPMLGGNWRRRFDRCLYLTTTNSKSSYGAKGLEKIGTQSIPNLVWNKRNSYNNTVKKMPVAPSDHFGIVIHFSSSS